MSSDTLVQKARKWIGAIPNNWRYVPLKYVCEYNKETLSNNTNPTYEFDYIDISSVNLEDGICSVERMMFKDAPSRARRVVRAGDVIMSTVRTYLKAIAVVPDHVFPMVASTGFLVARAKQNIMPSFLGYVLKSHSFVSAIEMQSVGVSYPAINSSDAVKNYIPLPPKKVQETIVSYLNLRCAPIDEAISRHRQAIDKLEEYRRVIVIKAVTKGLDPNVPLKSCGVSWIGLIPRAWQLTKIKYVAKVMSGATPKSDVSAYWDGDIPFITPADYSSSDHYISKGSRCITREGMNSCSTSLLPVGSVIVSTRAPIGLVAVNTNPVCTNQGCKGLVRWSEDFNFEYLYLLLSIADKALDALGNGTTYLELSKKSLGNFVIPKPSLEEQSAIVAYLNDRCTTIDEAVARHRLLIQKLEEYRQSLIHAAVTGRIDCTKESLCP